jgi:hypothetical protein
LEFAVSFFPAKNEKKIYIYGKSKIFVVFPISTFKI